MWRYNELFQFQVDKAYDSGRIMHLVQGREFCPEITHFCDIISF